MFIDFEGIEGSGKRALSSRLVARLRERGYRVRHAPRGGAPGSPLAERIRAISRDAHQLALAERAEVLLNAARQAQLAEEVVRPALARDEWVVADGFLDAPLALALRAPGGKGAVVDALFDYAAAGLRPDLVILVDVEPAIARARTRYHRILEGRLWDPSRKPQGGAGQFSQERDAFAALAARDPARWAMLDNTWTSLDEAEDLVLRLVLDRAAGLAAPTGLLRLGGGAGWTTPGAKAPSDAAGIRGVLLAAAGLIAQREPPLAAHLLTGLSGSDVDATRLRLARHAPAVVAHGLRGVRDAGAMALRHLLKALEPRTVAFSLQGLGDEAAHELRRELAARAPAEVARSLAGLDDATARELRRGLAEAVPAEVLLGLKGIDGPEAWALRERLAEVAGVTSQALSVSGVASDKAWAVRERLQASVPVAVIQSLSGIAGDRAHALRNRLARRVPRAVLESLAGVDDEPSWQLRELLADRMREAVESAAGIDSERAWKLRERVASRWPAAVVRSLAGLVGRERAMRTILQLVADHRSELEVVRTAAWALDPAREAALPGGFERDVA